MKLYRILIKTLCTIALFELSTMEISSSQKGNLLFYEKFPEFGKFALFGDKKYNLGILKLTDEMLMSGVDIRGNSNKPGILLSNGISRNSPPQSSYVTWKDVALKQQNPKNVIVKLGKNQKKNSGSHFNVAHYKSKPEDSDEIDFPSIEQIKEESQMVNQSLNSKEIESNEGQGHILHLNKDPKTVTNQINTKKPKKIEYLGYAELPQSQEQYDDYYYSHPFDQMGHSSLPIPNDYYAYYSPMNTSIEYYDHSIQSFTRKLRKLIAFPEDSILKVALKLIIPYGTSTEKPNWSLIGDYRYEVKFKLPSKPSLHRRKRSTELFRQSASIHGLMTDFIKGLGYDGELCLLRAICEVGFNPLTEYGLYGEILQLILSPGYWAGRSFLQLQKAEQLGVQNGTCRQYTTCPISIREILHRGLTRTYNILK